MTATTITNSGMGIEKLMKKTICILLKTSVISTVILFASCQSDKDDITLQKAGDKVEFVGYVSDKGEVQTRILEKEYIASEPFDMDFYIQLCCYDNNNVLCHTEYGTYVVPSSYEGRLEPKPNQENTLNWQDLYLDHTFYAWNIPWDSVYEINEDKIKKGIEISFENSSEEDGYEKNKNNAIYENFIGAKSEPYSYKKHGKYVDLTFHHLVSKIRIGSFILIQPSGAIQEHLQADVTFVGMPTEATFYPHPDGDGRPRVEPGEYDPDNGITYFINNKAGAEDIFYICPEVNFSKIDFKVKIKNSEYIDYDTYYGTFDGVKFHREPGTDYDREEDDDETILHAGEMMTLNIVLIPGIGPGLAIVISEWSTDEPNESQYHTYPGIYSDAEVKEMHDYFASQGAYGDEDKNIEQLFEMYGQENDLGDGKTEKVFVLYDDVDISKGGDANIFPIPKGYVVDGMGHTITMKTNGNNTAYVSAPYFNIGPVRDVWLTDGTNTIYIDADGYIYIYDSDKQDFVKTKNQLTPLTGEEKSYDISCKDGTVHNSTYYNNKNSGT